MHNLEIISDLFKPWRRSFFFSPCFIWLRNNFLFFFRNCFSLWEKELAKNFKLKKWGKSAHVTKIKCVHSLFSMPLVAITVSSHLEYDATSLARSLGSFTSSISLDGQGQCTAIFSPLQRHSDAFKSWLWLGHLSAFTELSSSHSFNILALCSGSLSCWQMNHHQVKIAMEQACIQDVSLPYCFHLPLNPDYSPSFCHWKTYSCFHVHASLWRWCWPCTFY